MFRWVAVKILKTYWIWMSTSTWWFRAGRLLWWNAFSSSHKASPSWVIARASVMSTWTNRPISIWRSISVSMCVCVFEGIHFKINLHVSKFARSGERSTIMRLLRRGNGACGLNLSKFFGLGVGGSTQHRQVTSTITLTNNVYMNQFYVWSIFPWICACEGRSVCGCVCVRLCAQLFRMGIHCWNQKEFTSVLVCASWLSFTSHHSRSMID